MGFQGILMQYKKSKESIGIQRNIKGKHIKSKETKGSMGTYTEHKCWDLLTHSTRFLGFIKKSRAWALLGNVSTGWLESPKENHSEIHCENK